MKGLMISSDFRGKILDGGMAINKRNYMILNKCCEELDLFVIKKRIHFIRKLNYYMRFLRQKIFMELD